MRRFHKLIFSACALAFATTTFAGLSGIINNQGVKVNAVQKLDGMPDVLPGYQHTIPFKATKGGTASYGSDKGGCVFTIQEYGGNYASPWGIAKCGVSGNILEIKYGSST